MTPTHPPRIGTHRRIANALERGLVDAPAIGIHLGMHPASIQSAIHRMEALGYVRRAGKRSRAIGHGRAVTLWELCPGAVVPVDSGAQNGGHPLRESVYVERVIDALRDGPKTRDELLTSTRMGSSQLGDVVKHLVTEGCISTTRRATRGRASFVYAFVREPEDPSAVAIRKYAHTHPNRVKVEDEEKYEGTSGTFVLGTVPSTETVPCAREPRTVALAACIDGYVDATATGRPSPCNQCPTGRARRADYAGCDFEESDDE